MPTWKISRRTLLKGVGASLALPLLETMGWADPPKGAGWRPPVRMCFIYVPFGVDNAGFWPADAKAGAVTALPPILEPLRPVIEDVLILGGLDHRQMEGDGSANHAREVATWLTGFASKPDTVQNAISADQLAAEKVGRYTVLPSLELGLQRSPDAGNCDQGYSCAYHSNISWRSATQPMPKEIDPRAVYERLFQSRKGKPMRRAVVPQVDAAAFANGGGGDDAATADPTIDQSMLDLVLDSAKDLRGKVSAADQRKLDEYLDGMSGLEKRIAALERAEAEAARAAKQPRQAASTVKTSPPIEVNVPPTTPVKFEDHARVMLDLITLAFQTDTTRIATLMFSQPFGRSYPEIGVPENHHEMSHHGGDPAKLDKLRRINTHHMQQFAYLLQRMKGLTEGTGKLLDNCMILYGSGMRDGNAHDHRDLPTILGGRGAGTIRSGRFVKQCRGNACDLLIGMLARAGVAVDRFGDGTKPLPDLA